MINNILEILFLIKYPLICLIFSFVILSFCWNTIFQSLKLKPYNNIQRVHEHEVSRLGGLMIYLFFWAIYLLDLIHDSFFSSLLISATPFILISLKEDLFHSTAPKNRLISMVMSCVIFFYINPITFPIIDVPYIGDFISFYPVSFVFFIFSILVVMNGMNLIDGMNGLFGFTAFFILLGIAILAFSVDDFDLAYIALLFSIPLIFFLFFNFPFGKLFIGDLGAYFYGFILAMLVIFLFGKYDYLLTWMAVLLLFYPCMELLFSFIRKIKNYHSPFDSDNRHLHTLIFKNFNLSLRSSTISNSLTTIALIVFWITPFIMSFFFLMSYLYIVVIILLLVVCYIFIYRFVDV